MSIINNSENIGSPGKDLIIHTLGKIYIKVGDKYHELNFKNINNSDNTVNDNQDLENSIKNYESDIVIVKNISKLNYPGDNKLIISLDGKLLITYDNKFKDITPTVNYFQNNKNIIDTLDDVDVTGKLYSDSLILDFLSGEISAREINVDNLNVKNINIPVSLIDNQFVSGFKKIYIAPQIEVIKVNEEDEYFYFYIKNLLEYDLFPIGKLVTNPSESFIGEIVSTTSDYIKVKIVSITENVSDVLNVIYNTKKLILIGDFIEANDKWGSIYHTTNNLRIGNIIASGDYSDLEFATVSNNVNIIAKSGIIIKCESKCDITITINANTRSYSLLANTTYIFTDYSCIPIASYLSYDISKEITTLKNNIQTLENKISKLENKLNTYTDNE